MSDLLTHWAVYDDCRRLASHDQSVLPFFNDLLRDYSNYARLGAIARYGSKFVPHILASEKNRQCDDEESRLRQLQRVAFATGGILHFPADQVFKPMISELANADWGSAHRQMKKGIDRPLHREISAYFDCHVFRKVYLAGGEAPFNSFLLAENASDAGRALEQFINALFQRALLSSHTLAPDMDNFDAWLDNLLQKIQPLYIDINLYTRVFQNPDSQKTKEYKVETDFYCDADSIIQSARAIQRGVAVSSAQIDEAVAAPHRSGYAECLKRGVLLLREVSKYWRGELSSPPDITQNYHRPPA